MEGKERKGNKGFNPLETKMLRPQWFDKEKFSSTKRSMSVDDIMAAMESGQI